MKRATLNDLYGDPEAFLKRLQNGMRLNKISQAELARASGFTEPQVSRWFRAIRTGGGTRPSLGSMLRLDAAYDAILNGEAT